MTPENHNFTIAHRMEKKLKLVGNPIRHRAECSCGWVGEHRRSQDEAESDGFAHQAVVQPPDLEAA